MIKPDWPEPIANSQNEDPQLQAHFHVSWVTFEGDANTQESIDCAPLKGIWADSFERVAKEYSSRKLERTV